MILKCMGFIDKSLTEKRNMMINEYMFKNIK